MKGTESCMGVSRMELGQRALWVGGAHVQAPAWAGALAGA